LLCGETVACSKSFKLQGQRKSFYLRIVLQKIWSRDGEVHGYFCGKAARLGFEARKTVDADSSRNFQRLGVGRVIGTSKRGATGVLEEK
jgi:hypothetical protein